MKNKLSLVIFFSVCAFFSSMILSGILGLVMLPKYPEAGFTSLLATSIFIIGTGIGGIIHATREYKIDCEIARRKTLD